MNDNTQKDIQERAHYLAAYDGPDSATSFFSCVYSYIDKEDQVKRDLKEYVDYITTSDVCTRARERLAKRAKAMDIRINKE